MNEKIAKKLLELSIKASKRDEVPVAAILTCEDKIIAKSYNKRNKSNLTMDHAEIRVIKKANKKMKTWRLNNCSLYVTLEPCEMCLTVIKEARIKKVYFLVRQPKETKKINKTELVLLDCPEIKSIRKKYVENLSNFWKNKRKK